MQIVDNKTSQKTNSSPYQQYALHFFNTELREEVQNTRNFLSKSFKKSNCIHQQAQINDIVYNIRKGLSIPLHAAENILIRNYINGHNTLCKQTIITLIHSFQGIKNLIDGITKGIETCYQVIAQSKLSVFILKQCFAYPNILKKLVSTSDTFDSFCMLWIQRVIASLNVFFPRADDKYEMELLLLELSCLFFRTSYCWGIPKYYKHIGYLIKKYEVFGLICKWLKERTVNWDYQHIIAFASLSHMNPTYKYHQIYHQTNYIFQCLMICIQSAQLRMVNGGLPITGTPLELNMMSKIVNDNRRCLHRSHSDLFSVCMQTSMDMVNLDTHGIYPGVKDLQKMRVKWKYKLLECQSSNCETKHNKNKLQLRKCSHCKITFYCSRHCQKYDWKFKHKFECNRIA